MNIVNIFDEDISKQIKRFHSICRIFGILNNQKSIVCKIISAGFCIEYIEKL